MMRAGAEEEENVVVVAVRAERKISKVALTWALTHIVRHGDIVTLLAVLSDQDGRSGWRRWLWGFPIPIPIPRLSSREQPQISASGTQMALQIDGQNQVNVRIKVVGSVAGTRGTGSGGIVAAESKRIGANWVVLDKHLKQERKHCLEELQCNIVMMKGSHAKVLRLNLAEPQKFCPTLSSSYSPLCSENILDSSTNHPKSLSNPHNLKASFIKQNEPLVPSSSTREASLVFVHKRNPLFEGFGNVKLTMKEYIDSEDDVGTSDSDNSRERSLDYTTLGKGFCQNGDHGESFNFHKEPSSYAPPSSFALAYNPDIYWIPENHISEETTTSIQSYKTYQSTKLAATIRGGALQLQDELHVTYNSDVREAVSLPGSSPSNPPPLCSLCRNTAPTFGKPQRRFTYQELEEATDGFSDANFIGEGRHGCVHKGALKDGQVVAVKRLKVADGPKGDDELFYSEVQSLSRAQHRNIVMLVGLCFEGKRRVLVYEYICNGSLDHHLHGQDEMPLNWHARFKIAVGAARGLRYLHEDCRVGFIVHGDVRSNNILLTHDFEPMVGGFSLTRWKTERPMSTFGYQAPEYVEYGIATEKADVYAFGVVLLELLTGRRIIDMTQPKGQQLLTEWARPLLSLGSEESSRTVAINRFLDPRLGQTRTCTRDHHAQTNHFSSQLCTMSYVASLCLRRDPGVRPSMSKVLKVFEGDAFFGLGSNINPVAVGSRSSRVSNPMLDDDDTVLQGSLSLRFPYEVATNALYVERSRSCFRQM